MYDKLFTWLVDKLNLTIKPLTHSTDKHYVGLLDIYGFEVFEVNGFE